MTILYAWAGACSHTGFTISAKVDGPSDVRLAVDTDDGFSNPLYSELLEDVDGWNKLVIDGLDPNTEYFWAIEVDNVLEEDPSGSVLTDPIPGLPANFSIAAGSCAQTGSTAITFTRIRARRPRRFIHMGDLHYEDPATNDPDEYLAGFEAALDSAPQSALYQSVPIAYMWDDHDWAPNDGDGSHVGRPAALATYREVVPHYPMVFEGDPDDTPVTQTFVIGRVRFVVLDTRSESDFYGQSAGNGIMLGETQLSWLLNLIETFTERLLVITVQIPWIVTGTAIVEDDWGHCRLEREAISNAIQQHAKGRVLLMHGDAHSIAMDDGTNTNFATDPDGPGPVLFAFAPLHQNNSTKGGPYTHGPITVSTTQYGWIDFEDNGTDIAVIGRGFRSDTDAQVVSHTFHVFEGNYDWGEWSEGAQSDDPGSIDWGEWSEWELSSSAQREVDTTALTNPEDRAGKGVHLQWWTGSRWDAVLPTQFGWCIFTDITGLNRTSLTVDSRLDARVDTLFHEGTLWVLRSHTSDPAISKYVLTGDIYQFVDEAALPSSFAVSDHDASPTLLYRTPNGRLWATVAAGGAVRVAISDDDGETWTSETVVSITSTGIAMLSHSVDTVVLVVMENSGEGRHVRTINQDAEDISSGEWATENLPALPSGIVSDDHGMAVSVDGHIYVTSKTEGSEDNTTPLLYLLDRDDQGNWSHTDLRPGPDAGETRPYLVASLSDLHIVYGSFNAPTDASELVVPLDSLTVGSPEQLITDGSFDDSAFPPRSASPESGILWLAHDRSAGTFVYQLTEVEAPLEPVEITPNLLKPTRLYSPRLLLGNFEPLYEGEGTLADRIMASLTLQGFEEGTISDRERQRLLAKLGYPSISSKTLLDLYVEAGEPFRILGTFGGPLQ